MEPPKETDFDIQLDCSIFKIMERNDSLALNIQAGATGLYLAANELVHASNRQSDQIKLAHALSSYQACREDLGKDLKRARVPEDRMFLAIQSAVFFVLSKKLSLSDAAKQTSLTLAAAYEREQELKATNQNAVSMTIEYIERQRTNS